jgi:hypothetical protein
LGLAVFSVGPATHGQTLITFDTDAQGNPLTAPPLFINAMPLTTLYSTLGVTFSGPAGYDGGAILNEAGNFGINPLSGENFLALNTGDRLEDGRTQQYPETITFSTTQSSVSIYAAGGTVTGVFTMTAYDSFNNVLGTDTVSAFNTWEPLSISATGIASVVLTETSNNRAVIGVYDNLSFTSSVPEPSTLALAELGGALALSLIRRRR